MTKENEVTVVQQTAPLPTSRTERERGYVRPATDVYESADAYVIMMDMPGAGKETINVIMDNTALVVKGAVKVHHRDNADLLINEIQAKGYYRVYRLGGGIDRTTVDARFEHGILTVKLFKTEEARPRDITIN